MSCFWHPCGIGNCCMGDTGSLNKANGCCRNKDFWNLVAFTDFFASKCQSRSPRSFAWDADTFIQSVNYYLNKITMVLVVFYTYAINASISYVSPYIYSLIHGFDQFGYTHHISPAEFLTATAASWWTLRHHQFRFQRSWIHPQDAPDFARKQWPNGSLKANHHRITKKLKKLYISVHCYMSGSSKHLKALSISTLVCPILCFFLMLTQIWYMDQITAVSHINLHASHWNKMSGPGAALHCSGQIPFA